MLNIVEALGGGAYEFLGFLNDGTPCERLLAARSVRHLGPLSSLVDIDADYVVTVANPDARRRIDALADGLGRLAPVLVHPSATLGSLLTLGPGTVFCPHASLTTNITVSRQGQILVKITIGHDAVLADCVKVLPGSHVSGDVHLQAGVTLGTNSSVIQGCRVGTGATVGEGAAIIRDIEPGVTAVGVPTRPCNANSRAD